MKLFSLLIFVLFLQTNGFCQQLGNFPPGKYHPDLSLENLVKQKSYLNLKNIATNQPVDVAGYFYLKPMNYWDAALNNSFYERLAIDRRKEFASVIVYDGRFVAHSIPVSAGSQSYQWIPIQKPKRSFAEQMGADIINSALGIKSVNRNGYYTNSGLRY